MAANEKADWQELVTSQFWGFNERLHGRRKKSNIAVVFTTVVARDDRVGLVFVVVAESI